MIDFPSPATTGQIFQTGGRTYKYDGTTWLGAPPNTSLVDAPSDGNTYGRQNALWVPVAPSASTFVLKAGDTMTGKLKMPARGPINVGFSDYGDSPSKNLLMNAQALINQRGLGAISSINYYADRWKLDSSLAANVNVAPALWCDAGGNVGAHLVNVVTVKASLAAADYVQLIQSIEGIFIQDIFWGSAMPPAFAQPLTFSCWAYSAVTPYTFCVNFRNPLNNASYVHPVTLPVAGWTRVEFTVPPPTIGVFPTDNNAGLNVAICLCAAPNGTYTTPNADVWQAQNYIAHSSISNLLAASTGQFALSAPMLEVGNTVSRLPRFDFSTELRRCQRYYEQSGPYGFNMVTGSANSVAGQYRMPAHNSGNLIVVTTPLFRVEKRPAGNGTIVFTGYQPYTGVIHNARQTIDGASVVLSNYGVISTWGPNIINSTTTLTPFNMYELSWTAASDPT